MKRWLSVAGICLALGALLGYTHWQTSPAIAANRQAEALAALRELVDPLPIPAAQISAAQDALAGGGFWPMCSSTTVAQIDAKGYGGPISLLISYQAGQCKDDSCNATTIDKVMVVKHAETPGIGDFFERRYPTWLASLAQLMPPDTAQAVDAIAGATITVNALANAVRANATMATAVPFASQPCPPPHV